MCVSPSLSINPLSRRHIHTFWDAERDDDDDDGEDDDDDDANITNVVNINEILRGH